MVEIKCKGSGFLTLAELIPFQGDLKELSEANYQKLKNQILEHGFIFPFAVWQGNILDGHQRLKTLNKMLTEGIILPEQFPIIEIEAPDEKSAKEILLAISSNYGKMTDSGLFNFLQKADIKIDKALINFDFDRINLDKFKDNFYSEKPKKKEVKFEANLEKIIECPKCGLQFEPSDE